MGQFKVSHLLSLLLPGRGQGVWAGREEDKGGRGGIITFFTIDIYGYTCEPCEFYILKIDADII